MHTMNNSSTGNYPIYILAAAIVLILLFAGIHSFVDSFLPELQRLNTEIQRTSGKERDYYIRKRRKLWLSLIPFVKK